MLDLALKNVSRQRTRTFLTVLGIIIGIAAIIALGSFAEGISRFIEGSLELSAGKVTVTQAGSGGFFSGFGGSDLTQENIDTIMEIDGVKEVVPMNLYFGGGGMGFGPGGGPDIVIAGIEPGESEFLVGETVEMYDGRDIEEGETEVMIVGFTFAEERNLAVGDSLIVEEMDFEIIGIIEQTNNANVDDSAVVNIDDVQELLDTENFQLLYVVPEDIKDAEVIADEIENVDDTLEATTPVELARQASEIVGQIRIFTLGIGGIAAVVGGLGVLNTMIMAVMERRREIGVMKAIGATKMVILKQILTESILISAIGGVVGILLGALAGLGLNMVLAGGETLAIVTPGLAASGFIFAITLGLLGGVYPAMKAASLDPVEALRYE
jgi:putative ABC transport system permease protein